MRDIYYGNYIPDITERYPEGFGGPFMSEKEIAWHEEVANNKIKLKEASENGTLVYFSDDCYGCKSYEDIGPTELGLGFDDIDDICHGICHDLENKDCPYRKEHKNEI